MKINKKSGTQNVINVFKLHNGLTERERETISNTICAKHLRQASKLSLKMT